MYTYIYIYIYIYIYNYIHQIVLATRDLHARCPARRFLCVGSSAWIPTRSDGRVGIHACEREQNHACPPPMNNLYSISFYIFSIFYIFHISCILYIFYIYCIFCILYILYILYIFCIFCIFYK